MPKMIFVNLPVADVARSIGLYEAMVMRREPQLCNERAATTPAEAA